MWLQIPLRSLWRNRRRTILSMAIIALGTAVSLFVLGFVENSRSQIRDSVVQEYGNLQIASPTLWNDTAEGYEYLLEPQDVTEIDAILAGEERYVGRTAQLQFPGLLAAGNLTQVVRITGLEPANGILDTADLVSRGRDLAPNDAAAVLIGRTLAEQLGLEVGDPVTLTLTTVNGAYNATPLIVAGIYSFSSEQVERQSVYMPLRFAQILLGTAGVDRVIVALDELQATDAAAARIGFLAQDSGLDVEPRTWDELSPIYRQLSSYFNLLFGFLSLAVTVLVFFIILQVLTLAFLERTREIGTLRALGTTQGEVFRLFFIETAWLALLGSVAGVLFGLLLSVGFNAARIEWLPPGTVDRVFLKVAIRTSVIGLPFLIGVVATLLSALYPSIQTSRIRVVDALRVT